MRDIVSALGKRIRAERLKAGLSQEKLAYLAECHPTYIGQIERGEKNATVLSIYKIASALEIPISSLFELIDPGDRSGDSDIPLKCYEMLIEKSKAEQEQIFRIICEMEKYKNN